MLLCDLVHVAICDLVHVAVCDLVHVALCDLVHIAVSSEMGNKTTISYLSVQQSKLSPTRCCG